MQTDDPTGNNLEFVKAAIRFPEDVFIAAQVIRLFPRSIAPYVWV